MNMSNFCHNPFLGLDIGPTGEIKPCCKFLHTEIPKFNIKDGIDRYKDSEWLNELQRQFVAGEKPKGCARCWKEETAGIASKRQLDYQRHQKTFDTVDLSHTNFINVGIAFGSLCNLACRTCGPGASSKWAGELKKIDKKSYPIHSWFRKEQIMNNIYDETQNAIHIDISGGESMLTEITEHFEYLDKFIKTGKSQNTSLHYTTNGTKFPTDNRIRTWQSFKEVDIQLSIDGIEKIFEYTRWPARWNDVYKNIKNYQKLAKKNKNIRLSISHTISSFTILYADQFFKWCIREGLPAPWLGVVSNPKHYDPSVFPNKVREQISSILQQSTIKEVRKLKDYLQYDNSQYFKQFLSLTNQLDKIRNQNFQKTFPELAELIRH